VFAKYNVNQSYLIRNFSLKLKGSPKRLNDENKFTKKDRLAKFADIKGDEL